MLYPFLSTPSPVVDLDIADRNIDELAKKLKAAGIRHRPHVKTHKSVYFAKKQAQAGAYAITCAKPMEAEVMADAGFDDILIAHILLDEHKLARYDALDSRVTMYTLVNSLYGARVLSDYAQSKGKRYKVLIEVDGNQISRGGVKPYGETVEFARSIMELPGIRIVGLMHYCGDIYGSKTVEQVREKAAQERAELVETARLLREIGVEATLLSAGSSFSSKHPELMEGVSDLRCGNYIFNDCAQLPTGLVREEDCALRILATVIAKPDDHHAIIDAGMKALSTDLCPHRPGYGYIVGSPEIIIQKQSEEHGFLHSEQKLELEIGDRVMVIPNHACTVVNLNDYLYGVRGGRLEEKIKVDARG